LKPGNSLREHWADDPERYREMGWNSPKGDAVWTGFQSAQFFQNSRLANVVGEMTFQFVAKICFRCIRAMIRRARPALKQNLTVPQLANKMI
jgi:hypothetical protein